MDDETKIHELIDQWEEAREQGHPITPEELCRDRPDLLPRVKKYIAALEWKLPWEEAQEDGCQSASGARGDSRRQSNHQHSIGDKFDRYELEEFLGDGGSSGEVWRTSDPNLGRAIAIKIVPRGERSLEEARKVAQLKHSGIVPVHYADHQDSWTYFVSDLIDGPSLAKRLEQGRLSKEEAVRIAADVADALHHAHSKGFIHRDVKPGNILLSKDGHVFLTDFGIAITAVQAIDPNDALRGTLAYMSPEQVRGDGHLIDPRTDIYSLGVVLFEMLTGERPFHGDPLVLRREIRNTAPPDPRIHDKSIPRRLASITQKCLQEDPGQRYPSAGTLATKLRTFDQSIWPRVSLGFVLVVAFIWMISFVLMQHGKEAREAYNVRAAQVLGQAVDEYHKDHDGLAMAERMGAIDPACLLSYNRADYAKKYREILMDCPPDSQAKRVRAMVNAKRTEPYFPLNILPGDVDTKGTIDEVGVMGGQVRCDEESSDKAIHEGLVIELDLDRTPVTDTKLDLFSKNLSQVRILKLCATQVTDAGLVHLKRLTQLQQLYLGRTAVTDAGLEQLAKLSQLQTIDLSDTDVTDAGLMRLHGLSQLRSLNVRNTKVAKAGMSKITAALPQLRIEMDGTVPQPP